MASADEDLNVNPLFEAFLASSHYGTAAEQQLVVCVPHSASLALIKVSKEVLETHLLKKSPYYSDQYVTLNGRAVLYDINEKILVCKQGFAKPRTVNVLSSEQYYMEDFESNFTVLRLNFPLEGKIPAAYYKTISESQEGTHYIEQRTIVEHETVLAKLTNDNVASLVPGGTLASIAKFIHQFNTSYVLVKGFIKDAGLKVGEACTRIHNETMHKIKAQKDVPTGRNLIHEVQHAIEACVMSGIHKKLFAGLTELHAKEEDQIKIKIGALRSLSQTQLGCRDEVCCQPTLAIEAVNSLTQLVTPLQKLIQLAEIARLIQVAVQTQHDNDQSTFGDEKEENEDDTENKKRDTVLTAEDMIPLTVYVLLHSNLQSFSAHLQYLTHFHPNKTNAPVDHLDVHLANFQAAIQLIDSGKLAAELPEKEQMANDAGLPVNVNQVMASSNAFVNAMSNLSVYSSTNRIMRNRHSRSLSTNAPNGIPALARPTSLWTEEELQIKSIPMRSPSNHIVSTSARPRTERVASFTVTSSQPYDSSSEEHLRAMGAGRRSRHATGTSRFSLQTSDKSFSSSTFVNPNATYSLADGPSSSPVESPTASLSSFYSLDTTNSTKKPLSTAADKPQFSLADSSYYSNARPRTNGRHNDRYMHNGNSNDDEKNDLGDFLTNLKKSEVVTGSFRHR